MKNIKIYLILSFGIAWVIALVIQLGGGLSGYRSLLLSACMLAPALSVLLTKLITREGWKDFRFRPRIKGHVRLYLLAWFSPSLLILFGAALFFILNPESFAPLDNPAVAVVVQQVGQQGLAASPSLLVSGVLIGQIVGSMIMAPVLNIIFCAGEEMGWRGYLVPQLLKHYSMKKTLLISGVIWGLWHAPMIAMGHNYGLGYTGWPLGGILAMIGFCFFCGCLFSYFAIKVGNFWPAALGHGALNGLASVGMLFTPADFVPNPFIGPAATGIIGGAGLILAGLFCFFALKKPAPEMEQAPQDNAAKLEEFFNVNNNGDSAGSDSADSNGDAGGYGDSDNNDSGGGGQ